VRELFGEQLDWQRAALDYHPACWMDVHGQHFLAMLQGSPTPFEGREALAAEAERRALAVRAAAMGPKARAKLGPIAAVEPARDPQGRPRVRVLLLGNAASTSSRTPLVDGTVALDAELRAAVRNGTVHSPLREYVMVSHTSAASVAVDPSQPFVAGVFMMSTSIAPAASYRAKIADWAGLNLPPPILCVISEQDRAVVDAYVLKLRAMVEQCGYSADECPVLTASKRDRALFEALALKLDEHVAYSSAATSGEAPVRIAEQLARAVAAGESDPTLVLLKRAQKVARRARVAEKQSIMDSAQRCLADERTRRAAIELMQRCDAKLDRALVLGAMRAMLTPATRPLNADFSALAEFLLWDDEDKAALDALLLDALLEAKPSTQRSKVLGDWVARSTRKETALALREAIAKAKGAMAARLTEVATALERRQSSG
jgi:hypothetical protein